MVRVIVVLGQECSPTAGWVSNFETEMKHHLADNVSFHYPPYVEEYGIRMWHPYTPKAEEYDQSHRAVTYHNYIGTAAKDVWDELDKLTEKNEKFAVVAISNGGAVGFEASLYDMCAGVLFVSSVPVLSQQWRHENVKCPTGFYHGTRDTWYFGGHSIVKGVAEAMGAAWFEFDGSHSTYTERGIADTLCKLMNADTSGDRRSIKRARLE